MEIKREKHFKRSVPVCANDILDSATNIVEDQIFHDPKFKNNETVLDGHFSVTDCPSGLVIHCNDTTARQDFDVSFIAPAGLTIMIVLSGKPDIELDGIRVSMDDANFVDGVTAILWSSDKPVNVFRRVRKKERVEKVSISLGNDWLTNWNKAGTRPSEGLLETLVSSTRLLQWAPSERIIRNALEIISDDLDDSLVGKLLAEGCAIEILREVFGIIENTPATSRMSVGKVSVRENSQARKINIFIEDNFNEDLTLAQIAAAIGMSVSSMQRAFKRGFGMTVMDSIRQRRLECARATLLFDGATVAQASQAAGYKSASNFTSAFFKQFGMLPSHTKA